MHLPRAALLCLLMAMAPAGATPPPLAAATAAGVLAQESLPELGAREAAADARITAAQAWFQGEGALATAWPALAALPLEDRAVLDGRIDAVEARMAARAEERVAPPPAALDDEGRATLRAAQEAALQAEDRADGLDLRLLTALRGGLVRAPGLAEPALSVRLTELRAARAAATHGRAPGEQGWAEAAAAAARVGAAEGALLTYRDAARRAHGVPGDTALDALVAADLAALAAGPPDPTATTDRLGRALPLLGDDRRAAVRSALDATEAAGLDDEIATLQSGEAAQEAALQAVDGEALPASLEVYQAAVAEAERAQRAATADAARLAEAAGESPTGLPELRVQAARLRRGQAEVDAELARRRFARAERIAELGLDGADVTEAEVEAARAAALEAREAAANAAATAADAEARFVGQISDMSDTVLSLLEDRKAVSEATQETLDDLEERLGTARTAHTEATALPPLAKERPRKLGQAYGQAATLVREGQEAVASQAVALNERLEADAETRERFPAPDPAVAERLDPAEVEHWDAAREALDDELELRERTAKAEVASALRLLDELRAARRDMRPDATTTELELDADAFFDELSTELGNVPVRARVWWWTAQKARGGGGLPDVGALVLGSVEVLVVLVLWFVGRRRVPDWTRLALEAAGQRLPDANAKVGGFQLRGVLVPGDPRLAHGPMVAVVRRLIDASAAWLAGALLWEGMPVVAGPLLLLAAWHGWRLAPDLMALALGETDDGRPSLLQVAPATRARAVSSAALLVGTFVALRSADWLATTVLMTDRISDLIRTIGLIAGTLAAFVVLVRWAPTIRAALQKGEQNRITEVLVRPSRSVFVQGAQAALGLVLLLERLIARLGGRLIESRAGLAWLGAALARQRLKEADGAPVRRLPPAVRERVLASCHDEPKRAVELADVQEGLDAWQAGEERGMIAVVSDRGSGKTRLLALIEASAPEDLPVVRLEPPAHLTDADAALDWLARGLGCAPDSWPERTTERAELLIEVLDALPPRIVLIDESHKLFLRAVGGFRALRRLLEVLHATSRTHLWVCAFHGPSWSFLEGVAESVNLAVFRRRVDLQPLSPEALAEWLEARTEAAGLRVSYADLVGDSVLRTDPARVEERARASFWRLLADEAQGNPRVARGYWLTALRAGQDEDEARVGLFQSPQSTDLADLSARELFLLTAIVIHDGLSIGHLTQVLNLPGGVCRSVGRRLEARGLLEVDRQGNRYTTSAEWGPTIQRVLRSKQFLHGGTR
jgi:type II secretory pathway predicted ATPase ExeA